MQLQNQQDSEEIIPDGYGGLADEHIAAIKGLYALMTEARRIEFKLRIIPHFVAISLYLTIFIIAIATGIMKLMTLSVIIGLLLNIPHTRRYYNYIFTKLFYFNIDRFEDSIKNVSKIVESELKPGVCLAYCMFLIEWATADYSSLKKYYLK